MAYIIGDIGIVPRISKRTLSCMEQTPKQFCKKDINDPNGIQKSIENAAKAKQKLENEIKTRNLNIEQSAKYSQNLDVII